MMISNDTEIINKNIYTCKLIWTNFKFDNDFIGALRFVLRWMRTIPSFWNWNAVYRNCVMWHSPTQCQSTKNTGTDCWRYMFDLGSSYSFRDQVKIKPRKLWQLGLLWARTTCHLQCICTKQGKNCRWRIFQQVLSFNIVFFFSFSGCQTCLHVFIGFLLSINLPWLKPLPVEVPGFTAWPWIMYKPRRRCIT